jgi:hypothetical protein
MMDDLDIEMDMMTNPLAAASNGSPNASPNASPNGSPNASPNGSLGDGEGPTTAGSSNGSPIGSSDSLLAESAGGGGAELEMQRGGVQRPSVRKPPSDALEAKDPREIVI